MNGYIVTIERFHGTAIAKPIRLQLLNADKGFRTEIVKDFKDLRHAEEWARIFANMYSAPVRLKSGNILFVYEFHY